MEKLVKQKWNKPFRRPVILLELLIAFALVSASALPFIHSPMKSLSKELELLFRMELARTAEEDLVDTRAAIYCDEALIKSLEKEESILYKTEMRECKLPEKWIRRFEKKIHIKRVAKKKATDGKESNLLKIKVVFRPLSRSKPLLQAESFLLYTKN